MGGLDVKGLEGGGFDEDIEVRPKLNELNESARRNEGFRDDIGRAGGNAVLAIWW